MRDTNFALGYRIMHQVFLASILALMLTGIYIHRPFMSDGWGFMMSMCRGVHFLAAVLLTLTTVIRIISMFVGPRRDWRTFGISIHDIKKLPAVLKYYARLGDMPDIQKRYNPLQMIAYSLIFLLVIIMILTGLSMRWPDGIFFGMTYGLFGSEYTARIIHWIVTWVLALFVMIHLYLAIRESFQDLREVHLLEEEK